MDDVSRRKALQVAGLGALSWPFASAGAAAGASSDEEGSSGSEGKSAYIGEVTGRGGSEMNTMTADNLRSAFGGESMAHMRYRIWGDKAKEDGFDNISRLFTAIAAAEKVHATNHFIALREQVGDALVPSMGGFGYTETTENLQGAINGEVYESTEMYPSFLEVAKMQDQPSAQQSFYYALEAEKIHAEMYREAKEAAKAGNDLDLGPVQICTQCGYTVEDDSPPTMCPICAAGSDEFKAFE
ncbi:MAG: rubrerythrin family protein [Planctomycetota bacterium]